MKTLLCIALLLFQSTNLFAQNWQETYQKADSLMQLQQFKESIPLYQNALRICETKLGSKDVNYFLVRNSLGRSMMNATRKEEAENYLLETVELAKNYDPKSSAYAQALHNLGTFYIPNQNGNNPTKSELYLKQALELRGEVLGERHKDYGRSVNNLSNLYSLTRNFSAAINLNKQFLPIRKELLGENNPEYALALSNLAQLYVFNEDHRQAEPLFKQSLLILKETVGEKHQEYANTLNKITIEYLYLQDFTAAESYCKQAAKIRKEILGERHLDYLISIGNLAIIYWQLGNFEESEVLFDKSLKIKKEVIGEKHPEYFDALLAHGALKAVMNKYSEAEEINKQVMRIYKELYGEESQEYIRSTNNLANLYKSMGNFYLAEQLFKQSLKNSEFFFTKESAYYGITLCNLANLYDNMGSSSSAKEIYQQSLGIIERSLSKNNVDYIYSLNLFATNNWLLNEKKEAISKASTINEWCIRQTKLRFPHLTETQRESFYREKIKRYVDNYNSFVIEMGSTYASDIYNMQLSSKAILMQASQKMKTRILNSGDSALLSKFNTWNATKKELLLLSEKSATYLVRKGINLDSITNLNEDIEKELFLKSEELASFFDRKDITWKNIQKALRKGEAALEVVRISKFGVRKIVTDTTNFGKKTNFPQYPIYGLTDTAYYAVLIIKKSSKQPEIVLIKNGNELEEKFVVYQKNTIQFMQEDLISYDQFWLPIAQKLKGIKKVYFSPDGVYNQISLNTLQNPKTKKFVLDEIELHLVTNTKDILAFGKSENKTLKAELLGYPLYDLQTQNADAARMREVLADSTRAFANFQQVSLLPGTKKEVEDIFQILSQKKYSLEILTEQNATEENIKKVKNPKILHLSTHGFFIDSKEKNEKVNPMLRSGLLLTGVSDYTRAEVKPDTEDGILTALEAANLDLDETDLVVLSACETGLGDVKAGEGVYGLQRAFKVAGAKSIVMSMWKVDDAVTQKLMTTFYQKFAESNNARQAFKEAQAIIKKQHPEPYYWGAFVMVGE